MGMRIDRGAVKRAVDVFRQSRPLDVLSEHILMDKVMEAMD